ncbi:uncharacterized protein LOC110976175 [Acanthaster planci]|uniref:Uncharacterized protein LOC110976175 n=1 Tax=Acanthaster planci TaxID=133434 RepID=A0A8B7XVQ1_ACAPL|nr:uncharacterized protein LOC110976175 [Acanthaster planci]
MAKPVHSHVILSSPLGHIETAPALFPSTTSAQRLIEQEKNFKLDCILVEKQRYKWSPDIIPKYDAMTDPYARHYFKSPMVQSLLRKTLDDKGRYGCTPQASHGCRGSTKEKQRDVTPKSLSNQLMQKTCPKFSPQSLNTLAGRHRAPAPPEEVDLAERRKRYCIDSVVATNQATKYKPLIRPYDAAGDSHARGYFQKQGIRKFLQITLASDIRGSLKHIHSYKVKL